MAACQFVEPYLELGSPSSVAFSFLPQQPHQHVQPADVYDAVLICCHHVVMQVCECTASDLESCVWPKMLLCCRAGTF
jgi:hypothetical protein